MTHVLRIAHLRIALHVANPEVGNREVHRNILISITLHARLDLQDLKNDFSQR